MLNDLLNFIIAYVYATGDNFQIISGKSFSLTPQDETSTDAKLIHNQWLFKNCDLRSFSMHHIARNRSIFYNCSVNININCNQIYKQTIVDSVITMIQSPQEIGSIHIKNSKIIPHFIDLGKERFSFLEDCDLTTEQIMTAKCALKIQNGIVYPSTRPFRYGDSDHLEYPLWVLKLAISTEEGFICKIKLDATKENFSIVNQFKSEMLKKSYLGFKTTFFSENTIIFNTDCICSFLEKDGHIYIWAGDPKLHVGYSILVNNSKSIDEVLNDTILEILGINSDSYKKY